jgi:hypothetical protein
MSKKKKINISFRNWHKNDNRKKTLKKISTKNNFQAFCYTLIRFEQL